MYSKGTIDEAAVNQLAVMTQYALSIQQRVGRESGSASAAASSDLGSFFPTFVWLVRDWFLGEAGTVSAVCASDGWSTVYAESLCRWFARAGW